MRTDAGARYRWLRVGAPVRYVGRYGRPGMRGMTGHVVAVPRYGDGGPRNAAVVLDAGGGTVAPAGCWRPVT